MTSVMDGAARMEITPESRSALRHAQLGDDSSEEQFRESRSRRLGFPAGSARGRGPHMESAGGLAGDQRVGRAEGCEHGGCGQERGPGGTGGAGGSGKGWVPCQGAFGLFRATGQ